MRRRACAAGRKDGPRCALPDAGVFEPEPVRCEIDAPFIPGQTLPRRLTAYELRNTVYDLVGIEVPFTVNFPQEETSLGFDNNARALQVTAPPCGAFHGSSRIYRRSDGRTNRRVSALRWRRPIG